MNSWKNYFQDLTLFSHVSLFDMTCVAVTLMLRLFDTMEPQSPHVHWRDYFISRIKGEINFYQIYFLFF
jgi:hypothetical protein